MTSPCRRGLSRQRLQPQAVGVDEIDRIAEEEEEGDAVERLDGPQEERQDQTA